MDSNLYIVIPRVASVSARSMHKHYISSMMSSVHATERNVGSAKNSAASQVDCDVSIRSVHCVMSNRNENSVSEFKWCFGRCGNCGTRNYKVISQPIPGLGDMARGWPRRSDVA